MKIPRLFNNSLKEEITQWEFEGIISKDQADQLRGRYQGGSFNFGYNIIISIALLFLSLSIIVIVGENWDDIPRGVRMVGVISITAITHLVGIYFFKLKERSKYLSIFFIGNIFYGVSIILIAQIYHLGEHMPDGVLWWALGTLPFGIYLRSSLLSFQTLVLGTIWMVMEGSFFIYPLLYPLFIIPSFYTLFKYQPNRALFFLTTMGTLAWLFYIHFIAILPTENFTYYLLFSIVLLLTLFTFELFLSSSRRGDFNDYGVMLKYLNIKLATILLFILSFEGSCEFFYDHSRGFSFIYLIFGGLLSLLSIVPKLNTKGRNLLRVVSISTIVLLWLIGYGVTFSSPIFLQIVVNLIILAISIALIIDGSRGNSSISFKYGVTSLIFLAILRYFELVGDYIGGSILLFSFAVILVVVAKYWKKVTGGSYE